MDVLLIELHLSTQYLGGAKSTIKFQRFFEFILLQQGFRFFHHHALWGWTPKNQQLSTHMARLGARTDRCCYEVALAKPRILSRLRGVGERPLVA